MLLINDTLIRMSKGFRFWIVVIALMRLIVLTGINMFASSVGTLLGQLYHSALSPEALRADIIGALTASLIMLIGEVLVGEAEFRCTAKARVSLREQILEKVLGLDVGDIDRLGATPVINSAVDGVELMLVYYNKYLPGLLYSVLAPVYLFFCLLPKSVPVAVMLFLASLVITPINNVFKVINDKMKGDYWNTLNRLTAYYLESINGLTTTELFNRGDERERTLGGIAQHLKDIIIDVMILNFSSTALNELLINLSIVVSTLIVCAQMQAGHISMVTSLTVLLLSYSFFGSIRSLQWIAHDALQGVAAAHSVADILAIDTAKPVRDDTGRHSDMEGIRFENVVFSYRKDVPVLDNVSLDIKRGRVTAIAGESGCGKSTIVNMLLRFYDAEEGRITLDGRDYLSMNPQELRKQIIMVPQSVYVFSGSIRENLLLADAEASDEELWEVLDQVKLGDWAREQERGLDEYVGDAGSRLSGGQRQKIGIARALLSGAEYIIFDEATSAVDEQNEQEIWQCIGQLADTRTLIIISHRLSTIRNADSIILLDDGCVAECGSHEELMALHGKYAALVEQQNELEQQGRRVVRA